MPQLPAIISTTAKQFSTDTQTILSTNIATSKPVNHKVINHYYFHTSIVVKQMRCFSQTPLIQQVNCSKTPGLSMDKSAITGTGYFNINIGLHNSLF